MGVPTPDPYVGCMTTIDPTATTPTAQPATASPSNALSITGLVLGIAGIVLGQVVLAIVAIVFAIVARTREPQAITTANWGLVLGLIGVFGGVLLGMLAFLGFVPFLFGLPFWAFWG